MGIDTNVNLVYPFLCALKEETKEVMDLYSGHTHLGVGSGGLKKKHLKKKIDQ